MSEETKRQDEGRPEDGKKRSGTDRRRFLKQAAAAGAAAYAAPKVASAQVNEELSPVRATLSVFLGGLVSGLESLVQETSPRLLDVARQASRPEVLATQVSDSAQVVLVTARSALQETEELPEGLIERFQELQDKDGDLRQALDTLDESRSMLDEALANAQDGASPEEIERIEQALDVYEEALRVVGSLVREVSEIVRRLLDQAGKILETLLDQLGELAEGLLEIPLRLLEWFRGIFE